MVHLDKLHEEMSAKGLTVVAVTKQDRSAVDKFIEETSATHPIVMEKTDSMRNYGCTSYPSAFLIGSNGRILWKGHPGGLQDSTVEEQLENAKLLPEFPKALSAARKSIAKDKFADAQKKVAKALAAGKLAEDEKTAAEQIDAWLTWYPDSTLEGATKDLESGRIYAAFLGYEHVADTYKGTDVAKRAAALAKELTSDKAHKLEIKAGAKFAKLKLELGDMTPKKAIKALQPLLGKKYAETQAGQEAAELVALYEKQLG